MNGLGERLKSANSGALSERLNKAARRLDAAGVASARLDVRLLAAHVLGWDQAKIISHPEYLPDDPEVSRFEELVARREGREPFAHITGGREFWGLDFTVSADTLVPRPDSETLIEAALNAIERDANIKILDLGTGSGCLLLALLSELALAEGVGVDVSEEALEIARVNAQELGLSGRAGFRQSDWGEDVQGHFDLVVCNPPYIAERDFAGLEPEVAGFEPRLALAGGADGLDCYRAVIPQLQGLMRADGRAFFEIGFDQGRAVSVLFRDQGYEIIAVHKDLAKRPRVIEVKQILNK